MKDYQTRASDSKTTTSQTFFSPNQTSNTPFFFQPSPQHLVQRSGEAGEIFQKPGFDDELRKEITEGTYKDKGEFITTQSVREVTRKERNKRTGKQEEITKTYTITDSVFLNSNLQKAKDYLDKNWAINIDVKKRTGGSGDTNARHINSFPNWVYEYQDKLAVQMPKGYVKPVWQKEQLSPNWDNDSYLAQRVIEAFLRAWHKKELGQDKPSSNIEELYKRSGVSEKKYGNAQAQLLGDPNIYGWCGPASYNAVVMGLFRNNLRLKSGKPLMSPSTYQELRKNECAFIKNQIKWKIEKLIDAEIVEFTLQLKQENGNELGKVDLNKQKELKRKELIEKYQPEIEKKYQIELSKITLIMEINDQVRFFLKNPQKPTSKDSGKGWLTKERMATGEDAYYKYDLKSGDIITQALMNGSPVSGHVLTVVKEERNSDFEKVAGSVVSTIYGISGNAGNPGGGSVKTEEFHREMPPPTLRSDLSSMQTLGNSFTLIKSKKETLDAEIVRLEQLKIKESTEKYDAEILDKRNISSNLGAEMQEIKNRATSSNVPYSQDDEKYNSSDSLGKTGRYRPNVKGNMWITTVIKASEYANGNKINDEVNQTFTKEEVEKKLKELGMGFVQSNEELKNKILEYKYGMEPLGGSIESIWPGAVEEIEGTGFKPEYD